MCPNLLSTRVLPYDVPMACACQNHVLFLRYPPPSIAIHQLGNLLEALGVEVTEERLREAFTELNRENGGINGALSLEDFKEWWFSGVTT